MLLVPQHIRPHMLLTSEQCFLVTYLLPHLRAMSILMVGHNGSTITFQPNAGPGVQLELNTYFSNA